MLRVTVVFILLFVSTVCAQTDTSIVLLKNIDSTFITDVRYATADNFTGKVLYNTDKVYLRRIVADSLSAANHFLKNNYNYSIKIFDGYRPLSVQKIMWEVFPDDRYVANPATGSMHNRGAAVDITLIDSLETDLDMGTEYDDFTKKAHYECSELSAEVKANRKLLRDVMIKFGFEPIETEWWHFDFKGWKNYSILNEPIN
ncbi:MAG: M15 family metallopeptidase [Bacteroidota bacterium]|nr:M15 family metallopeptidase [Bacteroidota bacterium]